MIMLAKARGIISALLLNFAESQRELNIFTVSSVANKLHLFCVIFFEKTLHTFYFAEWNTIDLKLFN